MEVARAVGPRNAGVNHRGMTGGGQTKAPNIRPHLALLVKA